MTGPAAFDRLTHLDPIARERLAREELKRVDADARYWASERRAALNELYEELGTWQKVADAIGQKLPTVYKAASQPRKNKP
jgi:hypothetical protein